MGFIQSALRFGLELAAIAAIGRYGLSLGGWPMAVGLAVGVCVVWGVFNVPGDPSRSGSAPVKVPGGVRLLLEWLIFGFAGATLATSPKTRVLGLIFLALAVFHYLGTWRRAAWLIRQR